VADARRIAHELNVTARVAGRALRRRFNGANSEPVDVQSFRATLEPWLAGLSPGIVESHRFHTLPATQVPWYDSGLDLVEGDTVTWLADGRVYLSRLLDIWVGPSFQLWGRLGEDGPVFRGTRATHTFTAERSGRLWLASYFPGEWADRTGSLATPASDYANVSGAMSVLLLKWCRDADVPDLFRNWARDTRVPGLVLAEAHRFDEPVPTPDHWEYLWFIGPGEIYRSSVTGAGVATICCNSHRDAGILRKDAAVPLQPGTRLRWSWRVDELPADLPEDTLPSHDYLSIAVEFDDGQDISYYWSSSLPVGSVYRCPLPTWKDRETHVVVHSGASELGQWLDEERDLFEDYRRIIGGPARSVVRVWLIAVSLFQRGQGRCEYARITVDGADHSVHVL
jgi:hypothetical protein